MTTFALVRWFLVAFFLTLPLNSVQNFRIGTSFGLLAMPSVVLRIVILCSIPNLARLLYRVRIPFALAVAGLVILWLSSTFDLSRALSRQETLDIIVKRTIGMLTFTVLLVLLNAKLGATEKLLDVYCTASALFLAFVAYMSIVVHGLPYVIPDPLYVQTYNKNQVAVLAVFSFICSLYLCLKAATPVRVLSLVGILVVIFLTYSRAAWLVSSAVFLVMIVNDMRSRKQLLSWRATAAIVGLVSLVWFSFSYILDERFVANAVDSLLFWMLQNESTGDAKRSALLNIASGYFSQSPLFGIGTGNFHAQYPLQTHNSYLQILAENGIFVFIAFMSFFMFIARRLIVLKKTAEVGLGAGLLTYCVCYMSVMNLLEYQLFYVALAILFTCSLDTAQADSVRPSRRLAQYRRSLAVKS